MTLYKSSGRGTWVCERVLLGLHVRKATGCMEHPDAMRVEATLLLLAKHGRRDLIEAFQAGHIRGPDLASAVEAQGVSFQMTLSTAIRLRRAMYDWLCHVKLAPKTVTEYRHNLGQLVGTLPPLKGPLTFAHEQSLERGPGLAELPVLVARYARRAKPEMFVQVKAAAQSFVRRTVPKAQHSDLWRDVSAIRGPKRKPRDVQGGLPPALARMVAERMGKLGPMWWLMCCSGIMRSEYWRRRGWEVFPDRIVIHGTKREARERIVPRLVTPVRPIGGTRAFNRALRAVGEALAIPNLTSYVARRTFAHFLELTKGEILASRIDSYMGHKPKGERALYREHDVVPYLPADTAALRAVIGPDPAYLKVMRA